MKIAGVCEKNSKDSQLEVEDQGGRPQIVW